MYDLWFHYAELCFLYLLQVLIHYDNRFVSELIPASMVPVDCEQYIHRRPAYKWGTETLQYPNALSLQMYKLIFSSSILFCYRLIVLAYKEPHIS